MHFTWPVVKKDISWHRKEKNQPEKRYKICLSEKEISELPEDSTDVFKRNVTNRYTDCPNASLDDGKYSVLKKFCYAEFLRHYYVTSTNSNDNDYQPHELKEDITEENHNSQNHHPKVIKLLPSKENLRSKNSINITI